jgi:hypothetical protein
MTVWRDRPAEERALLNPAFCSCLLWQSSASYMGSANSPLPFDVAFLVLPIVLHRKTRESLPGTVKTSFPVWINEHPLVRSHITESARTLVHFTKDAMMFGGAHGLFQFDGTALIANTAWKKSIASDLKQSTDEVRSCAKRADFLGKWLAMAGSPGTVMAILGLKA